MITKINTLPKFQNDDYCSVKIKSLYRAYGTNYDFCQFYVQKESDDITAIILKFYASATVYVIDKTNIDELYSFLTRLSVFEITSNIKLNIGIIELEFSQLKLDITSNNTYSKSLVLEDYKRAYSLFSNDKSGNICIGDFDEWYVDISHRVRHNAAYLISDENVAVVCLTDGENLNLNGIVVKHKKQKLGTKTIDILKNFSSEKSIFVACDIGVSHFYLKNGFKNIGNIYIYGEK